MIRDVLEIEKSAKLRIETYYNCPPTVLKKPKNLFKNGIFDEFHNLAQGAMRLIYVFIAKRA